MTKYYLLLLTGDFLIHGKTVYMSKVHRDRNGLGHVDKVYKGKEEGFWKEGNTFAWSSITFTNSIWKLVKFNRLTKLLYVRSK